MLDGAASFSTFTSGTKCERVDFAQRFSSVPKVLATVRHSISNRPQDAMSVWIEELKEDYFRICLREVKTFDGKHQNLEVDWLAFTRGGVQLTFQGNYSLKMVVLLWNKTILRSARFTISLKSFTHLQL
ncbi:hypothetical protein OS493_017677 [Desmophyllum pertusum]|uniref:H-type lectin domain-containing protein n=1 Tax=Desmophyllum pertusum TaxID=174260 RepID=A0A9W9ZEL9_9CNID|nr:hypothetical protein OS493_017677 [Desmophyllum pertusum]